MNCSYFYGRVSYLYHSLVSQLVPTFSTIRINFHISKNRDDTTNVVRNKSIAIANFTLREYVFSPFQEL